MTYEELAKMAEECGFTHTAPLDITTINLKQEVRDMCASGFIRLAQTKTSKKENRKMKLMKQTVSILTPDSG